MAGPGADPRRARLLEIYLAALAAVDGRRRVRAVLASDPGGRPVHLFAAGKAAAAMAQGALDALGPQLTRALVIVPDDGIPAGLAARPGIDCREAGHPLPDARSIAAGTAAFEFAASTPAGSRVLLCVSGGASALVEVPAPGVTLDSLVALYDAATRAGEEIGALNAGRRELSRIKGGQLPGRFAGSSVECLLMSDVAGDDPAVVGSGIGWAAGVPVTLVGTLDDALEAALRAARQAGLTAVRGDVRLTGEAAAAARRLSHELAVGSAQLQVWGGETVVKLPRNPGRGGRCQHLALAAAQQLAGHADYLLLAAGSDGRDGPGEDAGALVDGNTVECALAAGFDPEASLAGADSGSLLEETGDLIHTGATGTNVGDIVLTLCLAPPAGRSM